MEVMQAFKHIILTHEEELEGIIWAKMKKERILQAEKLKAIQDENRKALTGFRWSYNQTKDYMIDRAERIFNRRFVIDEKNKIVFELLCYYFSQDEKFVEEATKIGIKNASLEKGIFLAGNFGTGKTWMMQLFSKNQRQVFHIRNAKHIANAFGEEGESVIEETYSNLIKNPVNDKDSFYQPYAGFCVDDMGTEDIKNHYGNKKNVIGDLIEVRYLKKNIGEFFHGTSNLNGEEIKAFYGERVISRMREIFNMIEVRGEDRRK